MSVNRPVFGGRGRCAKFHPYTAVSQCRMSVTNFACGHLRSLQFKCSHAAIISTKVPLSALSRGWSSGSFPNNAILMRQALRRMYVVPQQRRSPPHPGCHSCTLPGWPWKPPFSCDPSFSSNLHDPARIPWLSGGRSWLTLSRPPPLGACNVPTLLQLTHQALCCIEYFSTEITCDAGCWASSWREGA